MKRYSRRRILKAVPVLVWLPYIRRDYTFRRVRLLQENGSRILREDGAPLEVV